MASSITTKDCRTVLNYLVGAYRVVLVADQDGSSNQNKKLMEGKREKERKEERERERGKVKLVTALLTSCKNNKMKSETGTEVLVLFGRRMEPIL